MRDRLWGAIVLCICCVLPAPVAAQALDERFEQIREMIATDLQQAELMAQELLSYSLTERNDEYEARSYYLLGLIAFYNDQNHLSVDYYNRALEAKFAREDVVLNEYIWNNLGVAYDKIGRRVDALQAYQHSLRHAEQRGDSLSMAQTWLNMGLLKDQIYEYEQAETLFSRAREVMYALADTMGLVLSYQNLSLVSDSKKDYDRALEMSERALSLAQEASLDRNLSMLMYNLALATAKTGDPRGSVHILMQVLDVAEEEENMQLVMLCYKKLASNYIDLAQFEQAGHYLNLASMLVQEHAELQYGERFWQTKANLHAKSGNYEEYLSATSELRELQQRAVSQENQKLYQELLVLHEHENMISQMQLLEASVQQKQLNVRYLIIILLLLSTATVVVSVLYVRNRRQMHILYRKAIMGAGRPFAHHPPDRALKQGTHTSPAPVAVSEYEYVQRTDPGEEEMVQLERHEILYNSLVEYMQKEKAYLDSNLTKADLVRSLSSNERYVSEAVRMHAQTNLAGFVNTYRVGESIRLLRVNGSAMSMDEIAHRSGFNSRSSFYRNFQEVTGLSPSKFVEMDTR